MDKIDNSALPESNREVKPSNIEKVVIHKSEPDIFIFDHAVNWLKQARVINDECIFIDENYNENVEDLKDIMLSKLTQLKVKHEFVSKNAELIKAYGHRDKSLINAADINDKAKKKKSIK